MPRAFPPDGYFRAKMCASFIVALTAALVVPAAALVVPPATRPPFGDPLGLRRAAPAALPLRGAAAAALPLFGGAAVAHADAFSGIDASLDLSNPRNFQPVCPASDGFYRFGKDLVVGLVGPESVKEYAPLIAGGLLRVRLELCVVESFVYEAIVPFVRQNGLSWVLPLHETVETFLAGVVLAVAFAQRKKGVERVPYFRPPRPCADGLHLVVVDQADEPRRVPRGIDDAAAR